MAKILITGGTGLIGKELIPILIQKGHEVALLSRKSGIFRVNNLEIKKFKWNPEKSEIDKNALLEIDYIIHLAGKNLLCRWTKKNKSKIIQSRVNGAQLLINTIKEENINIKKFISAGGIGYYSETHGKAVSEHENPGKDFPAIVCQKWENVLDDLDTVNIKKCIFRLGVVLSSKGGAYKTMKKPFSLGLGAAVGNGKQFFPWIHIKDVTKAFLQSIEDEDTFGVYNLCSPGQCSNAYFSQSLAKSLKKPFFMPNTPAFLLRLMFGKNSILLTTGIRASLDKILNTGFAFDFADLDSALIDLKQ